MKKYILGLVLILGLFVSFGKAFASGESDLCFEERKAMVTTGYMAFLPQGSKAPNRLITESSFLKEKYGTEQYQYGGVNHYYTFNYGKSNVVNLTPTQWTAIQAQIDVRYQKELSDYAVVIESAKKKLDKALVEKLAACNKLELDFIEKTTPKPVEKIVKVPVIQPAPVCDTTISDQTITSLKTQVLNLQTTNNSLSLQITNLQTQLSASQKVNSTNKNSTIIKTRDVPIVSTPPAEVVPVVEAPAPVKKGFWQKITGWLR